MFSNDNKVCVTGQNLKSPHKSLKKGVAANFILLVICFTILLGMPNDQRTAVPLFKGDESVFISSKCALYILK